MRGTRLILGMTVVSLFLLSDFCVADNLMLAQNGKGLYFIVSTSRSSETVQLACQELASYLQQISGASFTIHQANPKPLVYPGIIVGKPTNNPVLFQRPPLPRLNSEGFCIAVRDKQIFLLGENDRAVLYAVYAFLERLGCRWLAPDLPIYAGNHEFVPRNADLSFSLEGDYTSSPALALRKLCVEEGHSHTPENLLALIDWMPKAGFNTLMVPMNYQGRDKVKWDNWREALTPELKRRNIIIEAGGHGYQNFLNAGMQEGNLFQEHPEWFGMDENGNRSTAINRVFCTSNPKAVEWLEDGLVKYLKDHPEIDIFDFWPPDGAAWCECEKCKALGSPTERHARLVAKVAKDLHRKCPKVRLECLAYSSYIEPPTKVPFDESVLVDFCPSNQSYEYQIDDPSSEYNVKYVQALEKWKQRFTGDISLYSYYRKYIWNSLPVLLPHYLQNDLRFYQKIGINGLSTYAEPGDWFTYELNHYVLGRLTWNDDADVDGLIREFCQARYGPASEVGESALRMLEEVTRRACSLRSTSLKSPAEYDIFAKKVSKSLREVNQVAAHEANRSVQPDLHRLALMLEYARQDIALQRHRSANGPSEERQVMVADLLKFVHNHADEGVFVFPRIDRPDLPKRYGVEQGR